MDKKSGRKYDRKRWDWGSECDDVDTEKFKKHPYYDSDKRRRNEDVFYTFLMWAGVIMFGVAVVGLIVKWIG
tara:strand:+ start:402 stop:617 length:216 start_codon:yes stop_codon:yes gene_type:complete